MIKKQILDTIAKLRGDCFFKEYFEIIKINDKDALAQLQDDYLKKVLLHAYNNVPFYCHIFKEIGIVNSGTIDLSKFNKIPILTKEIMRAHQEELISKEYTTRKWYYNSSGGSTGEPIKFIQDDLYTKWRNAANYYYFNDILDVDEQSVKKVILWGSERDLFKRSIGLTATIGNLLKNTIFLNSFKMTENDMESYIKIINSYKPELIRGYGGSLYELCRYAERKNLVVHTPRTLVSAAETMREDMRGKIETIFGTKLYDFYGSREVSNLAGECAEGLMHLFMFWNYVEVLNSNNQPVIEGEEGKVVVTNLHNYSMPLIRYEIGDMAVLGAKKCKCGNVLPTLQKVTGRITDHFVKNDGTIIHGEFFTHLFYLKDWVKVFQIIQESYNTIKILVVLNENVNESEKKAIEDKIKFVMGQDCELFWDFVEEIPKTISGKYLYTKCLIQR